MANVINLLVQGMETTSNVDRLIKLSRKRSKSMRVALVYHLVDGHPKATSAGLADILETNLTRDLKVMNAIAWEINQHFEENYSRMMKVEK